MEKREEMTKHTETTDNPQTYWQHGKFSVMNSLRLLTYALAGIIHGFLPEIKCLQFYTSSGIIRSYRLLEKSRRHDQEIEKVFGSDRVEYIKTHRGGV